MVTSVPELGVRRRGKAAGVLALFFFTCAFGLLCALPASAELKLPLLPPLPVPSLNPDDALDLSKTVAGVTNLLHDATEKVLPTTTPPVRKPAHKPSPVPAPARRETKVDAWSLERVPAVPAPAGGAATAPNGTTASRPGGSYTSLVSGGLRAAAGRAANLAGPLAAPLVVALFAVGLLVFAAKGPTRLAKVEEDRQAFRDRRTYRL